MLWPIMKSAPQLPIAETACDGRFWFSGLTAVGPTCHVMNVSHHATLGLASENKKAKQYLKSDSDSADGHRARELMVGAERLLMSPHRPRYTRELVGERDGGFVEADTIA